MFARQPDKTHSHRQKRIHLDRKSTRLNSSHTVIYTLSLHDALPILLSSMRVGSANFAASQKSEDVSSVFVICDFESRIFKIAIAALIDAPRLIFACSRVSLTRPTAIVKNGSI